jgi:Family of unknown function (DUF5677)
MSDPAGAPQRVPVSRQAQLEAIFYGTCHLQKFVAESISPLVSAVMNPSPLEAALIATHFRIDAWLRSLVKLPGAEDVQAVSCGARGIFELFIDMAELSADHKNAERFHAFTFVERFRDAQLRVAYADETKGFDSALVAQERAFISRPTAIADCDRLIDKFWTRKKNGTPQWPGSWSGRDLAARCKWLGGRFWRLYRFGYKRLSWYVHPGAAGIAGIDEDGIRMAYIWASAELQIFSRLAIEILAKELHLFTSKPCLRDELTRTQAATGLALMMRQLAVK